MRAVLLFLALAAPASAAARAQPPPGAPRTVRVFALKNADAERLRPIVLNIFGRQGAGATADARTNSLVVTGDAATLEAVRALVAKLDGPPRP